MLLRFITILSIFLSCMAIQVIKKHEVKVNAGKVHIEKSDAKKPKPKPDNDKDYDFPPHIAYPPAKVPFKNKAAAQKWVDIFCTSSDRYLDVTPINDIVHCWGNMYEHPKLKFIVDDYEYLYWKDWSDEVTNARPFIVYLRVDECTMVKWGSDFVHVDEKLDIGFNISVMRPDIERTVLISRVEMTFETKKGKKLGIFLKFIRKSDGKLVGQIASFFALIEQIVCKVPEIIAAILPSVIVNDPSFAAFLENSNIGVVIFLVIIIVVMYIALLYGVIRLSKLCIKKNGLCKKYWERKVDYSEVSFTATEIDENTNDV